MLRRRRTLHTACQRCRWRNFFLQTGWNALECNEMEVGLTWTVRKVLRARYCFRLSISFERGARSREFCPLAPVCVSLIFPERLQSAENNADRLCRCCGGWKNKWLDETNQSDSRTILSERLGRWRQLRLGVRIPSFQRAAYRRKYLLRKVLRCNPNSRP